MCGCMNQPSKLYLQSREVTANRCEGESQRTLVRKYVETVLERRKGLKLSQVFYFEDMQCSLLFPHFSLLKKKSKLALLPLQPDTKDLLK